MAAGEELSRFSSIIHRLILKSAPYASLADRFREALEGVPPFLVVMIISMLPIFELRGGIPAGAALDMPVWQAAIFAVIGNMIPIPFILLLLGPVSRWLSEHSNLMRRFFDWLFARTRRKHTQAFERWKEFALVIFVAIPLPITGAWTGSVAAFLFDIPFRHALPLIFCGVVIAAVVVSLATSFSFLLGWQGSLIFFAVLAGVLAYIYFRARKEPVEELPVDDRLDP
ncbi:MAG: small multi-drug export protein [Actinobacteria bacterium]|nr:small multi-drug export protein [Actinomycetota bacterium]